MRSQAAQVRCGGGKGRLPALDWALQPDDDPLLCIAALPLLMYTAEVLNSHSVHGDRCQVMPYRHVVVGMTTVIGVLFGFRFFVASRARALVCCSTAMLANILVIC